MVAYLVSIGAVIRMLRIEYSSWMTSLFCMKVRKKTSTVYDSTLLFSYGYVVQVRKRPCLTMYHTTVKFCTLYLFYLKTVAHIYSQTSALLTFLSRPAFTGVCHVIPPLCMYHETNCKLTQCMVFRGSVWNRPMQAQQKELKQTNTIKFNKKAKRN